MREILFHGKQVGKDKWVEGGYYENNTGKYIISPALVAHLIIPSTVGQFTGLTDRNGVKIFEGDIIKHTQVYLHGTVKSFGYVKWSTAYACWLAGGYTNGRADMFLGDQSYKLEVLGNIYDNPELLEVSGNE